VSRARYTVRVTFVDDRAEVDGGFTRGATTERVARVSVASSFGYDDDEAIAAARAAVRAVVVRSATLRKPRVEGSAFHLDGARVSGAVYSLEARGVGKARQSSMVLRGAVVATVKAGWS
jgi:predicted alpha-1,6-mannanase (GH76 family)